MTVYACTCIRSCDNKTSFLLSTRTEYFFTVKQKKKKKKIKKKHTHTSLCQTVECQGILGEKTLAGKEATKGRVQKNCKIRKKGTSHFVGNNIG
ncbi:hypothetical protein POVWA2_056240 [Plasmodium ovale wallikeri]|uniref:Uncharacterized protein n=1 Tax=Plasmodium ovale wallikeri TaxID=864142 RepID=A0A1A8ZVW4_PLAOA|nr:hypothetical protein POVWA1_056860 [Plasmodium ovale wallikeri]SBT48489.1 hypothetical protein POVWA2_056240 [Plasmodium ovale wallikeri]